MRKPFGNMGVSSSMGELREQTWALGIETSNPAAAESDAAAPRRAPAVAAAKLGPDGTLSTIDAEPLAPTGRHDDDLIPAIDRLTTRVGLRTTGLARVCLSIGPGGFTGLRVAVATAKMLHEVTGAELVPVPSALIAAHALDDGDPPAAVCLASKRGTAHVTFLPERGGAHEVAGVLSEAEFVEACRARGVRTVVADHHLPEGWARATEHFKRYPPAFCAAACLRLGTTLPPVEPLELVPAYPREPEAVTRWRERAASE